MSKRSSSRWQNFSYKILKKFQRFKRPEALPIVLHSKRIYILPTRFGVFFGLFLSLMLSGALNYNNNMALLLTFLLGGLILLSPLYTVRNLLNLQITQVSSEPAFAGTAAVFRFGILNTSSQNRPVIWVEIDGQPSLAQVSATDRATVDIMQETEKRGWHAIKRARIYTSYPLGLFFSWAWLEPDSKCLVYPKPEKNGPALPFGNEQSGERKNRTGDEEWWGMRNYRPGDSPRLIAWKTVAKTDRLTTKIFAEHQGKQITLDFDRIEGLDTESKLSRLTQWVLEAEKQGLDYALKISGLEIPAGSGQAHQHHCLKALAEY